MTSNTASRPITRAAFLARVRYRLVQNGERLRITRNVHGMPGMLHIRDSSNFITDYGCSYESLERDLQVLRPGEALPTEPQPSPRTDSSAIGISEAASTLITMARKHWVSYEDWARASCDEGRCGEVLLIDPDARAIGVNLHQAGGLWLMQATCQDVMERTRPEKLGRAIASELNRLWHGIGDPDSPDGGWLR